MKAVIQRALEAEVIVKGVSVAKMENGVVTLLGIEKGDTEEQVEKMIDKICNLRIFEDSAGKMNRSVKDIRGSHLIVSQFTLAGDCSSGRRPSFTNAEEPKRAEELYEYAIKMNKKQEIRTYSGVFQADMKVHLVNDGPVTFLLEN